MMEQSTSPAVTAGPVSNSASPVENPQRRKRKIRPLLPEISISETGLILLAAIFLTAVDNVSFFRHLTAVYPPTAANAGFLVSMAIGLSTCHVLLFSTVCWRWTRKPVLVTLLLVSAAAGYFMDHYDVIFDTSMLANILQTNPAEAGDLLSAGLLERLFFLGLLPAAVVLYLEIRPMSFKKAILTRIARVVLSALVIVGLILLFSRFYTSFFREHEPIRQRTNPIFYIYSVGKYINKTYFKKPVVVQPLGTDAAIPATDTDRELLIVVVGEAARADRFSLNGYQRPTNPLLAKEEVYSFTDFSSCGTSTAYSVPCMFSALPRAQFSVRRGEALENALDVVGHAGGHVLWRDNNSSSKGVVKHRKEDAAEHRDIRYEDFSRPDRNPVCDSECRDIGMLDGLTDYIDARPRGDIVIVLHQMGNHGPAYYKRYPREFARFQPECRTNELSQCSVGEINNAYDNAILYTDFFLSRVIAFLKKQSRKFETAMIYMSDHGESLGEHGVYLHGLPYAIAPESQKHIAAIMWFGPSVPIDRQGLRARLAAPASHDNLFHTILGLLEIKTSAYNPALDLTAGLIAPEDETDN